MRSYRGLRALLKRTRQDGRNYFLANTRRQGVPGSKRVHIVAPVRNFSVLDFYDRTKSIVVLDACREDRPMYFVFDDDDTAAVCFESNQFIGGLELDVVAIAPKSGHQIGASLDNARPTGKVVENLIDDVVRD